MAAPKGNNGYVDRRALTALERFRSFCRFEPETGCVIWIGGRSMGRGHHVPYGVFWFEGKSWYAHRWSAKYIHGLDIEGSQGDHCCPHIATPNTLCVEHVQPLSLGDNREMQDVRRFEQRKLFVQLEVGLLTYDQIYGAPIERDPNDDVPFFSPPTWLGAPHVHLPTPSPAGCPF